MPDKDKEIKAKAESENPDNAGEVEEIPQEEWDKFDSLMGKVLGAEEKSEPDSKKQAG